MRLQQALLAPELGPQHDASTTEQSDRDDERDEPNEGCYGSLPGGLGHRCAFVRLHPKELHKLSVYLSGHIRLHKQEEKPEGKGYDGERFHTRDSI